LLEVIVGSVDDAISAERGGAGRLEIIRDYDAGGLTPSIDLVRQIAATVNTPLRAMLRENVGFTTHDEDERRRLCATASEFANLGVEGIVLGFLREGPDGTVVDHASLSRVLACTPNLKATFHRAFEQVTDPLRAIAELKQHPQIDRILVSADGDRGPDEPRQLLDWRQVAKPEIELIIGGGTDADIIRSLKPMGFREFHVGKAARDGGDMKRAILVERVAALVDLVVG
jgi:copper homeostasis protein